MLHTTSLYNIPPCKIKITTQESVLRIPINSSPEDISATVLFRHKSVLEMGMGWPLGPESPGRVSEIKQRLSCVLVETLMCPHIEDQYSLFIVPATGYSRSRNCPEKANQKYQGSSSNSADNHRALAIHQALFNVLYVY